MSHLIYIPPGDDLNYALFRATTKHDETNYTVESPTLPEGDYLFSFYYNFPGGPATIYVNLIAQTGQQKEIMNDHGRYKEWNNFSVHFAQPEPFKVGVHDHNYFLPLLYLLRK